ncbi:MAG: MFS transporter, partial [Chitinophagaceae bacterium]|nr:MFS transporter [Chitinophagaceae bacterium]
MMKIITRAVWILSMVSMFADIASEMLYPVIPVYLKEIGFSIILIGLLEGVAEFIVGLTKGYFGKLSDERGVRLPFVKLGYLLSAISKPMMVIFAYPLWIFASRTTDRLGKGIRTAARDALLSENSTRENKARVFGFHRGWDTFGAVIGPLIALAYLYFYPGHYKTLFYLAAVPGLISVALIFLLKEKKITGTSLSRGNFFSFFSYRKVATPEYRQLVAGLVIFALANSSDVFLILKMKQISGSDELTIGAYIFYNLVYALFSFPLGILADRIGKKKVLIGGLLIFAAVYTGFAITNNTTLLFLLFGLYGIYAAATEGIAKAWITNIAHGKDTATAVGFYSSCQSVAALFASVIAAFCW